MSRREDQQRLAEILEGYIVGVRAELADWWKQWQLDLSKPAEHEVIGALLARLVTLSTQLAMNPGIWNAHIGPLILRTIVDTYINLMWILEDPTRSSEFIDYGLGQAKLELEHLQAMGWDASDPTVIEKRTWLEAQKLSAFTTVNVGSWSGSDTRKVADSLGYGDRYNLHFSPFSAATHSHWHHVSRYNLEVCTNPLHRFHRMPVDPDIDGNPEYLLTAAEYVHDAFAGFGQKMGITCKHPSSYAALAADMDTFTAASILARDGFSPKLPRLLPVGELEKAVSDLPELQLPDANAARETSADFVCDLVMGSNYSLQCVRIAAALVPAESLSGLAGGVLAGHMVRLCKLYETMIHLSVYGKADMAPVQMRCVVETAINLIFLLRSSDTDESVRDFLKTSLYYDKRLWDSIQARKHDPVLPMEKRMLDSIERTLARFGMDVEDSTWTETNWEDDVRAKSEAIGMLNLYEFGYLPTSSAAHGTWYDIESNHLTGEAGDYLPEMRHHDPHPQILAASGIAALRAADAYGERLAGSAASSLTQRMRCIADWFGIITRNHEEWLVAQKNR